jgi:alanyl-tRNA synthetase
VAQAKQTLIEQLAAKEEELQSVRALQIKNQQLEQRVAELEKALEGATTNNWSNTFNAQAAKVVNSDLEKTIAPLMAKVERLQNVVELKDKELTQLRAIGIKQQEELKALQQNTAEAPDYEEVITTFGEVGQSLGWHGWGRRGYRSEDGTLHTGINALAAFISDLTHSDNLCPEVAF